MAGHAPSAGGVHVPHIIPLKTYIKVFSVLIFLTVITVAASRVDFGIMNSVVAFGIASVKAGLVMAIFMHLKYDNMLNRVIIGSSVFFLIVLYLFCFMDEASRVVIEGAV
jgi:cytochrome c oxidase subunit IV